MSKTAVIIAGAIFSIGLITHLINSYFIYQAHQEIVELHRCVKNSN